MADEIRLHAQLSFAKSGRSAAADSGDLSITMAGTDYYQGTQVVGITEEALFLGDVNAASAYYLIRNLDATNRVELRWASSAVASTQIGPGRAVVGQFSPAVSAPFVIAFTAPVTILVLLIEA